MPRLFVALRPPAVARRHLTSLMHGLAAARWQNDDQMHITLRFIGEVDLHGARDLAAALAHIAAPPMTLTATGLGIFDRRGHIDALWAGVTPREHLAALHRKIDRACISTGLAPEGRAYLPHITLARFGRYAPPVDGYLAEHGGYVGPDFTVTEFGLYESILTRAGAVYHLAERYPLDG